MVTAISLHPPRTLLRPLHASPAPLPSTSTPLSMSIFPRLRRLPIPRLRRGLSSLAAVAAVRQDSVTWAQAPLTLVHPAAADGTLFHVAVDVSDHPDLAASFTTPGQYLQLRVPDAPKPAFLAMASPPSAASSRGEFEFLVKRVPGSTVELLCGLRKGEVVDLSGVMGRGFDVDRFSPPEAVSTVFIFATGSGIRFHDVQFSSEHFTTIDQITAYIEYNLSPIRSLIESGFSATKRSDVRLFYGARNLQRMAYQDRFKDWESTGIRIIPVLSRPDDTWKGERGYVQAAFSKVKEIMYPSSTGAVLCGHQQMMEDVTSVLVADGVSREKILKNF